MPHRSPAALHSSFFERKCKSEIFKCSSGTLQAFAYSSGARITWDVLQRVESSWEGWAMPNHFPSLDPISSLMVHLKLFHGVEEYLENIMWLCDLSAIRSSRNKKIRKITEMPSGSQWEFATLSTFCYRRTFPYYSTPLKCCFSHLSDFTSQGQGRAEINARLYVASHMGIRTRKPKEVAPQVMQAPLQSSSANIQTLFAIFVYICSRCRRLVPQWLQMKSRTRHF